MPIDPKADDKKGEGGTPTPEDKKTVPTPDPKEQDKSKSDETVDAAYVEKLKAENAERRVENKKLKQEQERIGKALAMLQGKEAPDLDPIEQAKKATDSKLRNAMMKGELANRAKDAHDAGALMKMHPEAFKDVTVDLEGETVDSDELDAAIAKVRKQSPYLFRGDGKTTTKGAPLPKDGGQPSGGENHHAAWKQLKEQGRDAEAQEFYSKHRASIMAQMRNGNL
jgi:hypothetical protein